MTQATQKITTGYKQTEIGVIPADWDVSQLGKLCNYQNGTALEKYFNNTSGLKVISIGNYSEAGKFVETGSYIDRKHTKDLKKFVLNKDDLTMILNDKTAVGTIIGRVLYIEENDKYIFNQRTMRLSVKENTDPLFLFFQINGGKTHKYIVNLAKPGTQIYVNTNDITELPIAIPKSKPEQTAIANALSDTDALIEKLEKLIAKKKAIKQGAMQQLLTPPKGGQAPKKRLPEFGGEWEVKKLGEVCDIKKGQLITESTRINGDIPVIAGGKTPAYFHNKANRHGKTITISGSGASAGYVAFHKYPIFASDCSTIEESRSYSIEYIYFLLQSLQDTIYKMQTGGAQPHIHPNDLNPIIVSIPKPKEQTAIATVLSDMDAEIEKLENKLGKYRQIKTGMMQQLLTGKIRLLKK